jgi:hypothetical protein
MVPPDTEFDPHAERDTMNQPVYSDPSQIGPCRRPMA